jgi:MoxR-like ATPase
LHLVVLASCLTALSTNHLPLQGVARRLLAQTTIPAVVAMQDRLQIESAQYFAQRFYRRLVDTGEVDKAANAGRRELFDRIIRDPNHPLKGEVLPNQWGVPVLFLRVLDGRLFNVKSPTQGEFHTQARSLAELSGDDLRTVADSMLRSAASQVGLQLNLAMPNLAQSFMQAMQQARLHPEGAPTPEPRRIFGQPRQEDQRWWLVWASALYRKHPARRTVLFARREALKKISRLLDRERLGRVTAIEFREAVQQGGGAVWIDEMTGNPLYQVGQLLGSGLANHAAWPEDDLSGPSLSHISLQDDATLQPIQVSGHLALSADWRMALRGFVSYSGADTPARIKLSGNLTWDTDHPKEYDPQAYQQLLYGENPLQAFTTLSQAGNPASSLDAESAALALHAVYPDRFLPYRESHQRQIFACLDLQNSSLYSSDYAGYCALARDLLADGDLGLDDLVDVHFFLQRLAHGDYLTPTELKQHSSGQVRPRNLRTQLRPVQIDPEQVDSDLVIRQGVLVQAAAALNAGKHIILIGPPGTGKTTLAEDLCRFAHDWDFNRGHFLVTATADWTTFDTIGGYMPESGDRLVFRPGIFLEAIASEKWLIIDEINRADIDKAFGELFTVLSGQAVTLPYKDDGRLVRILPSGQTSGEETRDYAIPKGWRIIGTMNIYDKASLFSMSYAFMRRFAFIDVPVPESRSYGRLLDYFIQHNELKDEENAGQDLRRLFLTDGIENPLMANRAVGPAIARDILDYLRSRTRNSKDAFHHGHLAEALSLYVLPQLDGLEQDNIVQVYKQLRAVFKGHAEDPVVKAMFVRIKELFPFVPQKLWGD